MLEGGQRSRNLGHAIDPAIILQRRAVEADFLAVMRPNGPDPGLIVQWLAHAAGRNGNRSKRRRGVEDLSVMVHDTHQRVQIDIEVGIWTRWCVSWTMTERSST